jgi:hypothetical protein
VRTEELIADLAAQVTPVRPLPPPGVRALIWIAAAVVVAGAAVAFFGARADIAVRLTQPDYLVPALLGLTASIFAVVATLVLAIPGAERTPVLRQAALGAFVIWAAAMGWAVVAHGRGLPITSDPHWPICFSRVVLIMAAPCVTLFAMARRATPLRLGWTAGFAAVAAASMAAVAVQIICPVDDAGHAFLGHFVPVLAIVALGIASRRVLDRVRSRPAVRHT